nr:Haem peroxidase domain containing protein [Haemonchus contortus]
MRLFVLLLMTATSARGIKFPCGPSFTPCETKAFGLRNLKESALDGSKSVLGDDEKRFAAQLEISKVMSHNQLITEARKAKEEIEKLFNQTEKQLQRVTSESNFSTAELTWAQYTKGDRYSKYLSFSALIAITATQRIANISSSPRLLDGLPLVSVEGSAIQSTCPISRIEECIAGKYRTYNGQCNNVNHPQNGAIYSPLQRLLAPDYEDKISKPRVSLTKSPLPSASDVAALFTPAPRGHATCSLMLAQWASFIYDDIAHVATNQLVKGVSYSRSLPAPRENCSLGPREQGNTVSGYLDASQIYGSSQEIVDKMRSFKDGLLNLRILSASHGGLPQADDDEDCKSRTLSSEPCFMAGSSRINLLPSNAVMYTIWMRQHNSIAGKLKEVNPVWSDEKLFQEARRVVIAQIQHITYNEFIPVIVGKENLKRYALDLQVNGYDSRYDMVFNDPSFIYQRNRLDAVLRFLTRSPIMKPGLHMTPELKHAFKRGFGSEDKGIDMAAQIIQMGRDHGIPGYLEWRRHCQLDNVQSFASMSARLLPSVNASLFEQLYESPEDVDLIVGGLAEAPLPGSLLGPTLSCLFAKQMEKTKRGDRFWYENFFYPSAFSTSQLEEIRKTTLARIICDNSDDLRFIQHNVFSLQDEYGNCPVSCTSSVIDSIDFSAWRDEEPKRALPITKATLEKAIRLGIEQYNRLQAAEGRRIRAQGPPPNAAGQSAVFTHAALMAPKRESIDIARTAGVLREATQVLIKGTGLNDGERLPLGLDVSTLQQLLPDVEVESIIGNFTPFLGFDAPRAKARSGGELPSARVVSNIVHNDAPEFHVRFTHMLMQFGQILDHDMMHSPIARGPNNTILNCSSCDSQERLSIHCFPIKIGKDDPFFPATHQDGRPRCMPFTRSLLGQLTLGYRNQLNQLTAFLDASSVYGSTECEANQLRLFSMGKLNFTDLGFNKEALPQGRQERDCRSVLSSTQKRCFVAGDERNNEQPGLTVIHTILLREHNRIAAQLRRVNNFWTDEQLYQEARRINIAKLQHVIFKEWLPVVLGCETMAKYDLMPKKSGYFTGYDPHCDPAISQEMSTAAFRFGHTLIRAKFPRLTDTYRNMSDDVELKDHFSDPSPLYERQNGHLESMLMGLIGSESMAFDRHITNAVRNHLFAKPGGPLTGIDLPAVNIQRGRDHGVQPYNKYRALCGLRPAQKFDDLRSTMDDSAVEALRKVYEHVDDIDLFPGIMSERSMKGALVGPTLACIIGEQMQRLKKCDRFYYENSDPAVRFTPDQLAEIRKTTFAKIICENSQFARKIQPNVFLMADELTNAPTSCLELPDTDLFEWLDREYCLVDHRVINLGKTKRITPCVTCTCTREGPECHSITIDHCDRLFDDYLASEIAKDPVCVIQCARSVKERLTNSTRTRS